MTRRWWIYLVAFILGVALTVGGLALANTLMVLAGVVIGVALFFSRKLMS